jgi:hypothetical protein
MRPFALLIPLFFAACCAHNVPPPQPAAQAVPAARSATAEPADAEGCRACGGEWANHGLSQQPTCLCPTSDADKRCRDGGECQGQCLADDGEREVIEAGPPARGYFVGKCSHFRTSFGCHRALAAGALKAGPTALEEPPNQICAD